VFFQVGALLDMVVDFIQRRLNLALLEQFSIRLVRPDMAAAGQRNLAGKSGGVAKQSEYYK
jgi:hypothetical protein